MRFQAARTAGTQGSGLDDLEKAPAAAAHQASGGMQDAQGLRSALARAPSKTSRRSWTSSAAMVRPVGCQALFIASEVDGYLPMPQSSTVRMAPSTPGFDGGRR